MAHGQGGAEIGIDHGPTLTCNHEAPIVAHSLRAEGFDASEDGTRRGTPIVPVQVAPTLRAGGNKTGGDRPSGTDVDTCETLIPVQHPAFAFDLRGREGGAMPEGPHDTANIRAAAGGSSRSYVAEPVAFDCLAGGNTGLSIGDVPGALHGGGKSGGRSAIAFSAKDYGADAQDDVTPTLRAMGHAESHANAGGQLAVALPWAVRRLTPVECERLQGMPDDHTMIPWRGRNGAPDGPRYKALGNSMASNAMEWLGERISMVEAMG